MTLIRLRPARRFRGTWNDLDRWNSRRREPVNADNDYSRNGSWTPSVDIHEQENQFLVTMEVPGVNEDDIQISLNNGVLTVQGEKKHEVKPDADNRYYRERTFGEFKRHIRLDNGIDAEKIEADYENGVLTLSLPKTEQGMDKQIPVKFK